MLRRLFIRISKISFFVSGLLVLLSAPACRLKEEKNAAPLNKVALSSDSIPADSLCFFSDYFLYRSAAVSDTTVNTVLLILLDPQGQPDAPIRKYRSLSDSLPVLMMGSEKLKNGISPAEALPIVMSLLKEARRKFPGNNFQLYLAGFSGGGALAISLSHLIPDCRGVLLAAAPGNDLPAVPMIGFAGKGDANLADMQRRDEMAFRQGLPSCMKFWPGRHEWPDSGSMKFGFEWMKSGIRGQEYSINFYRRGIAQANSMKNILEREAACRELDFLCQTRNLKENAGRILQEIHSNPEFQRARSMQIQEMQSELELRSFYQQAFFEKDFNWWELECRKFFLKLPIPWKEQRMLGFLSLLAYSASQSSLSRSDPSAARFIRLYRMLDPENPEAPYLEAVFQARNGNRQVAEASLRLASSLGFSDWNRFNNQAEFRSLGLTNLEGN